MGEVLRGHASLSDAEARAAFVHTLRTIVDLGGQRVNATDRLYLAEAIPFLIVWGERDPIIPVEHGARGARAGARAAASRSSERRATSRTSTTRCASSDVLIDFIETTEPSRVDAARWGKLLRSGAHKPVATTARGRGRRAAAR